MRITLSRNVHTTFSDTPILGSEIPTSYIMEAFGKPVAIIANVGAPACDHWDILRIQNDADCKPYGDFASADEAMAALSAELEKEISIQ